MLHHACGYALANKGHDTKAIQGSLGRWAITSTAIYTALAPNRFKVSGALTPPSIFSAVRRLSDGVRGRWTHVGH
jgi:hypothetical protein